MISNYICLDIGGTSIKSAIINSKSYMIKSTYQKTYIDSNKHKEYIIKKFIQPIKKNINYLSRNNKKLSGISIAIGGPFDYNKGISYIKNVDKYDSIYGINVKKMIQKELQIPKELPFIFDIDSWCFGRGEAKYEQNNKYKRIIVLTMGTGVGSSFLVNKKIVSNGKGVPYLGWISGKKYKKSILNDYISSTYMSEKYFLATNKKINIKTMAELAKKGDPIAKSIFSEVGLTLGSYLSKNFVRNFKAECILFGGQISLSGDLFINEIKKSLKNIGVLKKIKIAENIETSALYGASYLLQEKLKEGEYENK